MKSILSIVFFFFCLPVFGQKNYYLLVGTSRGKSSGIYVYDFNNKNGTTKIIDSIKSSNPSYLAVSDNQKFVYAVSEVVRESNNGQVKAFAFDNKTGRLKLLNEQASMGDHPCYISIDKTGKWISVGNYSSGNFAVLPINQDGSLGTPSASIQHTGQGVNKSRQESPHVHATVFSTDNNYLYVPDLGIDKVMIYSFNAKTGAITPSKDTAFKLEEGSGPRHIDFHPNGKWVYLIQEMAGTVTAFNYKNGRLERIQSISSLPKGYSKPFTSADIHVSPNGKFLYASNRDSSNTIAIFKIDQLTGKLYLSGHQSTLGKTPRNFNLDPSGNFLLVANQNSNSVVIFKINRQTGLLTDTGQRIDVGNPVCIKWIEK